MRLPAWVLAVVAVLVGTEFAHAMAYRVAHPDAGARADALAAGGHGYLEYAPLAGGLALAISLVALFLHFAAVRRGAAAARLSAVPFALLVPLTFALQEHLERFAHDGSFPVGAALEPTFVVGLWLQAPFALLAWLAARALLRAAAVAARGLAEPPARTVSQAAGLLAPLSPDLPRLPALASGRAVRGPPPAR